VSNEVLDLYHPFYTRWFESKNKFITSHGSHPSAVHHALHHALSSTRPKTRYAVAQLAYFPAFLVMFFRDVMPDRVWDFLAKF